VNLDHVFPHAAHSAAGELQMEAHGVGSLTSPKPGRGAHFGGRCRCNGGGTRYPGPPWLGMGSDARRPFIRDCGEAGSLAAGGSSCVCPREGLATLGAQRLLTRANQLDLVLPTSGRAVVS